MKSTSSATLLFPLLLGAGSYTQASTASSSSNNNRLDIARKLSNGDNPGNMMKVASTILGDTNPLERVRNLIEEQQLYANQHDNNNNDRNLSEGFALLFCEVLTSDTFTSELPPTLTVTCDTDGNGELTLKFEDSAQECDEDYCISDLSFEMMMDLSGLSFDNLENQNPSSMSMELCLDFDSGFPNSINGVRFCFGLDGEIEFADGDGNTNEPIDIKGCVATSNGNDCGCEICDNGEGVNFDCGNALVVQDCEDIGNIGAITESGGTSLVTSKLVDENFDEENNSGGANLNAATSLFVISGLVAALFAF